MNGTGAIGKDRSTGFSVDEHDDHEAVTHEHVSVLG